MAKSGSDEKGADVRFPPPLVWLGGVILGLIIQYFVMAVRFPMASTARFAISGALLGIGVGLPVAARGLFKKTGQSVRPWDPTPELIFDGPYRFTRNPMYVGLTTVEIGLGLLLNNVWVSALALPALATVHFIAVLPEEKYLSAKFGDSYRNYLGRVRRYL
jgi:protein-S-isoprenylcysteine O-methyltransferase Ste14